MLWSEQWLAKDKESRCEQENATKPMKVAKKRR
jgi:hypothetical protein